MPDTPAPIHSHRTRITILSDIHYAGAAERACGNDYELRAIRRPLIRALVRFYRHYYWMRKPLDQGRQLDRFLDQKIETDYVIANGDYSCDTGFVGVSHDDAFQSAAECLGKLRGRFGDRARFVMGDHELGKRSLFGEGGGMPLASWRRATEDLNLPPFWRWSLGNYQLIGVNSSLLSLPAHPGDALPAEWPEWQRLRAEHLAEIRTAFDRLSAAERVLLFCHDPTALPFLWRETAVRNRLPQVEQTIIGHLHSKLILWKSRLLSGLPPIHFLGHAAERYSAALRQAHLWKPFRVRLCPALSGIQLLNDGGYYVLDLDPAGKAPAQFTFHSLPR